MAKKKTERHKPLHPELKRFIDAAIVPALVDRVKKGQDIGGRKPKRSK